MRVATLLFVALVMSLAGCHKYNALVEANATADEKWANIDTELQRRYDLIPNLVKTVKAMAANEAAVLENVTQARASATQIHLTGEDLSDPAKMAAFQAAQDQLKGSLSRLMMTQEKYPELGANAQFHDLTIELEGTENRIVRARQEYNSAVKTYNAELGKVGGSVVNSITGHPFKPRIYWSASEAAKTTVPSVDF